MHKKKFELLFQVTSLQKRMMESGKRLLCYVPLLQAQLLKVRMLAGDDELLLMSSFFIQPITN